MEVDKHACLAPDRLLVPSTPNQDLMAPPWIVEWLRANLPPSADLSAHPRALYVTRGPTPQHSAVRRGGRALATAGRARLRPLDPGSVSVQEQIDHFAAADVIVAPHGAALANLVFARPGARLLELFAPDYVNPCYWAIADAAGLHYRYLVAGDPDPRADVPMTGVLRDISIPPDRVLTALDKLLAD